MHGRAMLSKALRKLSEQALAALKQPENQRLCRPVLVRYRRPCVRNFKYDAGAISFVIEPRYVERKEWGLTDQYRFINQVIKTLSSYTYCSEALSKSLSASREHLEPRLARYLQVLLSSYVRQQDNSIVTSLSQTFLHDVSGEPIDWAIKGAIRGVSLETDQCRFGKYLLRRPVAKDFELEQGIEDAAPHPLRANPPSAVLEFRTHAPDHYAVRQEYAGILNLLRLFRVGSVRSVALFSMPQSVLQTAGVLYSAGPAPTPYVYTLADADQALLGRFLEHHQSCATGLKTVGSADGTRALICRAYNTYNIALLGQIHAASQLLLALECLEALLLREEERIDAGCQLLSKRLSGLLDGCGAASEPVVGLLQQAYDIRNAGDHLISGSNLESRSLTSLARSLLNYARITLITFLRTADGTSNEAIIKILDGGSRSTRRLLKNTHIPL